jgi:acetyl esterase/lipase
MPAMSVPFSSFASPEARRAFIEGVLRARTMMSSQVTDIAKIRAATAAALAPWVDESAALTPVSILPKNIAGVATEIVEPKEGVAARNRNRVLINLHGGGFFVGAGMGGRVEAVPIAGVGKIRVVTVDYREGPENQFPAASEDVVNVYKDLLKHYSAGNIGIYGCSAGGLLTAEAEAMIQRQGLPNPGAIGIFCASAGGWAGGDSTYTVATFGQPVGNTASPHFAVSDVAYFRDADLNDPMVLPIRSAAILAKFPPTLILTGSRDVSMSAAIHTHAELVKNGVDADLHVWEGVGHGFFYDPSLPESQEAYAVIVKFFDKYLGH